MTQELIASLDIGASKIILLLGSKDSTGKADLKAIGRILYKDTIDPVDLGPLSLQYLLIKAFQQIKASAHGMTMPDVNFALSASYFKSIHYQDTLERQDSQKEISRAELDEFWHRQKETQLPEGYILAGIYVKAYSVDGISNILNAEGYNGLMLSADFHLLAVNEKGIDRFSHILFTAGLKARNFIPQPVASAFALLDASDFEEGVIMADIGALSTDICIYCFGSLYHTAHIPIGSHHVTEEIARVFGLYWQQAEQIKKMFGIAFSNLVEIDAELDVPMTGDSIKRKISLLALAITIQSVIEKIFKAIKGEVSKQGIDSSYLSKGIKLTGGGSLQKGIDELGRHVTGLEVTGFTRIDFLPPADLLNTPGNSAALGLLLKSVIE